ncbi:ribokinase [Mycobacterium sp. BMJ-28]
MSIAETKGISCMAVSPKIAVVGSINVDLTARVDRLPAPGETIGGGTLQRAPGGKGANQAVAAARLGATVRMIGAVGDDPDGRWSVAQLQAAGIDATGVKVVGEATGIALIGVDDNGENQIMVCSGANTTVSIDQVQLAPDETVLTQLEISVGVLVALARRRPGFLVVNAAPAQELPQELIAGVDLFVVNETEYALMPELRSARRVAVTYGERGACLVTGGVESARVPAVRTDVVNTVGAGDAFCAALVLALRLGASDTDALATACAVGAAAVEHPDSQPPFQPIDWYSPSGAQR